MSSVSFVTGTRLLRKTGYSLRRNSGTPRTRRASKSRDSSISTDCSILAGCTTPKTSEETVEEGNGGVTEERSE